jgi:tRNA-splicing endonuclease subunit Sen54
MDDNLEQPDIISKPLPPDQKAPEDDEQSSEDEDEGPDWTKLS